MPIHYPGLFKNALVLFILSLAQNKRLENWQQQRTYRSVLSKWEFFIKMRAAYLLSPSFITRGRMGASKAALILMKNSHFDRTLQYFTANNLSILKWQLTSFDMLIGAASIFVNEVVENLWRSHDSLGLGGVNLVVTAYVSRWALAFNQFLGKENVRIVMKQREIYNHIEMSLDFNRYPLGNCIAKNCTFFRIRSVS